MMAGRSHHHHHHAAYRLFATPAPVEPARDDADEYTESDIWGCSIEPAAPPRQAADQLRVRTIPAARGKRSGAAAADRTPAASLPVGIPDWSKILGGCAESYSKNSCVCWAGAGGVEEADDDDELLDGGRRMVPPHELLWRSRGASMSVHEGIGRTLKGRDLRRVRNAVWEITGFQD
ncbi:hypothetical protein Cni_G12986 [Canna indica]|uniref:Senescence regulator n=1 Tax=Canna indica TaxID=4628 RepID=A0AAQ3KAZ0_9LILI|nr:hypothetical protein Cni_G12986 [Canna indica]